MAERDEPSDPQSLPAKPPRRPHALRRLYNWVLHWADTPYATPALATLAFAESSFFPIPPDPLLIAMGLGKRRSAFRYATVCSVASVLGGILGFVIGYYFWQFIGDDIIKFYGKEETFNYLVEETGPWMLLLVLVAAFTPIPYKVFTIAAGVYAYGMDGSPWAFFLGFVVTSALGRAGRFFLVSTLIHFFGEPVKRFIDRYFNWCALAFGVLLIGAFILVKYLV